MKDPPANDPMGLSCYQCKIKGGKKGKNIVKEVGSDPFHVKVGKSCIWCDSCTDSGMGCNRAKIGKRYVVVYLMPSQNRLSVKKGLCIKELIYNKKKDSMQERESR